MAKVKKSGAAAGLKKKSPYRKLFCYNAEQLKNALEAIKNGIPVATASKSFNVPRTTLRHKMAGEAPVGTGKMGPEVILGKDIEADLCTWILTCCRMGFPVNKDDLTYSVKKIVEEKGIDTPFKNCTPGKTWFKSFMARHPEISLKQSEYINMARAQITEEKIRKWFQETLDLLGNDAEVLQDPSRVWNMDETSVYLNPAKNLVLAEKGKHVYGTSSNSDKENVTTLVTVNALGEMAPPLTIYKFDRLPLAYVKAAPPGWGIGKSENGWMTAKNFYEYFANVFHPFLIIEKKFKFPVLVFLDGHTSHLSIQLSQFCRENGIIIACLMPNTTHILQPLDVAVFFPLKSQWRKALKKWRFEHNGQEIKKHDVPALLNQIFTNHTFTSCIVNGFRKCGLHPFNPNFVDYSRCTLKLNDATNPVNNENYIVKNVEIKVDYLQYLESKMNQDELSVFKQCKAENRRPENPKSESLFEVWIKFKQDSEGHSTQKNEDLFIQNVYEYMEPLDIIEFPFPEFEEVMDVDEGHNTDVNSNAIDDSAIIECDQHDVKSNESDVLNEAVIKESALITNNEEINSKKTDCETLMDLEKPSFSNNIAIEKETTVINLGLERTNLIISTNEKVEKEKTTINSNLERHKTEGEEMNGQMIILEEEKPRVNVNYETRVENDSMKENRTINIISDVIIKTGIPTNETEKKDRKILGDILVFPSTSATTTKGKKKNNTTMPSVLTSNEWLRIAEEKEREKANLLLQKDERKKKRAEISQLKKNKKIKKNKVVEPAEETDSRKKTEKEQNKSSEVVEESFPTRKLVDLLTPEVFVIVVYQNKHYPGQVKEIDNNNGYLISTMEKSGQGWKWPDKVDEVIYDLKEIKEIIEPPTRKNSRGVYTVPEMVKYNDFTFD